MRAKLTLAAAAAATLAATVLTPLAPASSVVGGDLDGNGHPNVAMVAWFDPVEQARFRCTATLISERVLLTAGHCTDSVVGKHIVTFESVAPPLGNPPPAATGYTTANKPAGYVTGTAIPHPLWTGKLRNKDLFDTGVVVLDQPVGLTPATLAPRDYFADKAVNDLKSEPFTVVGYGVFFERADGGPQKPVSVSDRTRRVTTAALQNIVGQAIQLNESATDSRYGGGTCFGDSGGPIYYRGLLVGDTSYGGSQFCKGMGGYQRIDDPRVWDWLQARIAAAAS